jgi:hypothetical protein
MITYVILGQWYGGDINNGVSSPGFGKPIGTTVFFDLIHSTSTNYIVAKNEEEVLTTYISLHSRDWGQPAWRAVLKLTCQNLEVTKMVNMKKVQSVSD